MTAKGATTPDIVRRRIRAGVIVNLLQKHVHGKHPMSSGQVRAAEVLLRKVVPDLAAIQLGIMGDHSEGVTIFVGDDSHSQAIGSERTPAGESPARHALRRIEIRQDVLDRESDRMESTVLPDVQALHSEIRAGAHQAVDSAGHLPQGDESVLSGD